MTRIPILQEPTVTGQFDEDNRVFNIYYRGTLTARSTQQAYVWLLTAGSAIGLENIRAFVFDFTSVKQFKRDNAIASQKQSREANSLVDLSRIPAALVVGNVYQEQFVLLQMKVNGVEERTRICHSRAEANAFIEKFHQKLQKSDAEAS